MVFRTANIDGRGLARGVIRRVAERLQTFQRTRCAVSTSSISPRPPGLAIVQIGGRTDAISFTDQKAKAARECNFHYEMHQFPPDVTQSTVERKLVSLSGSEHIDGIVVQLPIPMHLPNHAVLRHIAAEKDVDALHPSHVGELWLSNAIPFFQPCTAVAVERLIGSTGVRLEGTNVVVIGAGPITGCPISRLLLRQDATVTICHAKTRNIEKVCQNADVLVSAVGRPGIVRGDWVKPGAVVIDVGITRTPHGTRGDVDWEGVQGKASHVTPVPGGVGPMTVAVLMESTLRSFLRSHGED